jgi:hypothetical protein
VNAPPAVSSLIQVVTQPTVQPFARGVAQPAVVTAAPPAEVSATSTAAAKTVAKIVPPPGAVVVEGPGTAHVLATVSAPPAPPSFAQAPPGTNLGVTGIAHIDALELQRLALLNSYLNVTLSSSPETISIGVASAGGGAVCGGRSTGTGQSSCDDPAANGEWIRGGVQATGVVVSAGFVVWAMRGAGLLTSILSAAPAWRHLDPMPVLAPEEEKPDWGDESDDETKREDAAASKLWRDDNLQEREGGKS